jgi:hypothetical protein
MQARFLQNWPESGRCRNLTNTAEILKFLQDFGQTGQILATATGRRGIPFYAIGIFSYKLNAEKYFQEIIFF